MASAIALCEDTHRFIAGFMQSLDDGMQLVRRHWLRKIDVDNHFCGGIDFGWVMRGRFLDRLAHAETRLASAGRRRCAAH